MRACVIKSINYIDLQVCYEMCWDSFSLPFGQAFEPDDPEFIPPRGAVRYVMKSTKVLNPRRCIMRVYTREIRMRVHENTHGKMADCTHGHTTEGVLDLCNGAVSEKTPQIF